MFAYLFAFLASALLLMLSEKIKDPLIRRPVVFLSLAIPIVLAAIRSPMIGTDVRYYAIPHFNRALSCPNFSVFLKKFDVSLTSEPLYALILFAGSRISKNYHIVLLFYQTITISFMYLGFSRLKKIFDAPIWLGMLIYYLTYFNISLNIIRQSMAVSVVFYAVTFLFEDKKIIYVLFMLVAFMLHGSGVLGFVFLPMYMILKKKGKGLKYKDIKITLFFTAAILAAVMLLDTAVRLMVKFGLLRANILNYLSGGKFESNYLSPVAITVYMALLFAYVIHFKQIYHKKLEGNFFIMVSFVMFVCSFGSLISLYISRICYYFIPFQAFALSSVQKCYKKGSKLTWYVLIIGFVLATWYVFYVHKNNHSTYPYAVDMSLFN